MSLKPLHKARKSSLMECYAARMGTAFLRHRAEMAERARRVEAERANQTLSRFIANFSHELRTPLNAIIGFSKLLAEPKLELDKAEVAKYANFIGVAASQLLDIVNDILDISKIQSGMLRIEREEIAVEEILRSCLAFLKEMAREKGVTLLERFDQDLPMIHGDPVKLRQVFTNIVTNAIKFTPAGGAVEVLTQRLAGDKALVAISDTGMGMEPEQVEIALMPFGQVHEGRKDGPRGTGLGLPIANALVQLHGGKLEIMSRKGVGTTVMILLPISHTQTVDGESKAVKDGQREQPQKVA